MKRVVVQWLCLAAMVTMAGCRDKAPVMLQETALPIQVAAKTADSASAGKKPVHHRVGHTLVDVDLLRHLEEQLTEKEHESTPPAAFSEGERFLVSELTR